jgi:hypothetical protein
MIPREGARWRGKSINMGRIKGNQYDMACGLLKIGGVGFYKMSFILQKK